MLESEYWIATLALREAGLAVAEYGVWVAAAQVLISLLQTGIVAWGIRAMVRANAARTAARARDAEAANKRHTEVMQAAAERHDEAMKARAEATQALAEAIKALKEQRERADKRHAEAMQALKAQGERDERRHVENMQALKTLAAQSAPERGAAAAQRRIAQRRRAA